MKKKYLDNFYRLTNYDKRNNEKILYEEFLSKEETSKYNELACESYNMFNSEFTLLELDVNNKDVISLIRNNEFEINNVDDFIKSINQSTRSEFLTPYSKSDFTNMKHIN